MTESADAGRPRAQQCFATGLTAVVAILTAASPGGAEPVSSPLAAGLLGAPTQDRPIVERFATDGGVRFVLDRTNADPLMRIEGREEVLTLRVTPGPRGDEFLKTDTGRVVLRITALGGVTFYAGRESPGAPAAAVGAGRPLSPGPPSRAALRARLEALSRQTTRALGRPVAFEARAPALTGGLALDAAERVADGLLAVRWAGVRRIVIVPGAAPAASLEGDSLRVMVAPRLGHAGSPSVAAVKTALSGTPP
jgi:hypothetical protein